MDYGAILGGASGIAIGSYLFAVVYEGNLKDLGTLVKSDAQGYLEFVAALFLLGAWHKYGPGGAVEGVITAMAIVAMFLRFWKANPTYSNVVTNAVSQFAAGKMSLTVFVKTLLTGDYNMTSSAGFTVGS